MTPPAADVPGDIVIHDRGASYHLVRITGRSTPQHIDIEVDLGMAKRRACLEAGAHRVWFWNVAKDACELVSCSTPAGPAIHD